MKHNRDIKLVLSWLFFKILFYYALLFGIIFRWSPNFKCCDKLHKNNFYSSATSNIDRCSVKTQRRKTIVS